MSFQIPLAGLYILPQVPDSLLSDTLAVFKHQIASNPIRTHARSY
jgi:hypothetical protein